MTSPDAQKIWDSYYTDQVEVAADGWSARRILDLLSDTAATHLNIPRLDKSNQDFLDLDLRGECKDGTTVALCRLHRKKLSPEEKDELLDIVAERFPPGQPNNLEIRKRVAKTMGVPPRDRPEREVKAPAK